jgi:hypothetical protein
VSIGAVFAPPWFVTNTLDHPCRRLSALSHTLSTQRSP